MTEEKKGEYFLLSGAVIGGFFPIITVLSFRAVPSMISLAVSAFLSTIPFFLTMLYKKRLAELKDPLLWKNVLSIVILWIMYYSFFYFGLTRTTPGNASIIALFEVFTSFVFFHVIRRDHFSFEFKVGSVLAVLGATIVLAPNFSSVNTGDLLILCATFFAPGINFFQQKAKKTYSTETILFLRHLIATPFVLLIAYAFGQSLHLYDIKQSIFFLVLNGIVAFWLSKIFWMEGIARVAVTKAGALTSITPLFTLLFAWLIFHQAPTVWQVSSLVPFFFAILLLTDNFKLKYGN